MNIIRYARVYKVILQLNFSSLVVYRTNFVNNVLSSIVWGAFSLISIILLTARTETAFGWRREEILLLTGIYAIVIGLFHTLWTRNFERLSQIVFYGRLDQVLLKPIDPLFFTTTMIVNYASITRILIGIGYSCIIWQKVAGTFSVLLALRFFIFLFAGLVLLYSIWVIAVTPIIWFPRLSNITDVLFTVSGMARFPREMYSQLQQYIFFFLLPLTFILVTPTKALLEKATVFDVSGLLICTCILFFASRAFFKYALRHYEGSGS